MTLTTKNYKSMKATTYFIKKISIVTACLNERENIPILYQKLTTIMNHYPNYDYEIIYIDNFSTDGTREVLRELCAKDHHVKAIFNVRNFGAINSPWYAFLQAKGDAVIAMCSDLEDPPELIPEMLKKWEEGFTLVFPVRRSTEEQGVKSYLRSAYYWLITKISDTPQIPGFTGFGLYDRAVMDIFRSLDEPYPYTRGLVCELGWNWTTIPFDKPCRIHGKSKYNLYSYLATALLGIVKSSKLPLRLTTLLGLGVSATSLLVGLFYLIMKLVWWDAFQAGIAPLLAGVFFFMGLLFFSLGMMGEYIGVILTRLEHRPLVIEQERINFDISAENTVKTDPPQGEITP